MLEKKNIVVFTWLDFVQATFPSRKNQKDFYNKLF